MLDHGHPQAWRYPIGKLIDEVELVSTRLNQNMAQKTMLAQMVISSIPNQSVKASSTKSAQKNLQSVVERLMGGE